MTTAEATTSLKVGNLETRAHAVDAAIRANPGRDVAVGVQQVLDWVKAGENRSREAGVLLAAALRGQNAPANQVARQEKRNRDALVRQRDWAKANLPHLPEVYVMPVYEILRDRGVEPDPAVVEAQVRVRFKEFLS